MLRGTVYLLNRALATDGNVAIARTIVELDVRTPELFKQECKRRASYSPPAFSFVEAKLTIDDVLRAGTDLEYGPIGAPWGK